MKKYVISGYEKNGNGVNLAVQQSPAAPLRLYLKML